MQIKAAQEVRDCQTEVFFGMNLRQLVFTGLAGASAVLCWFLLRDRLSMETISWLCILAALPFGAFGFVRWHGMYLEQILPALFRSRILHRGVLYFRTDCTEKKLLELYMQEERKGKAHAFKRKEGKDKTP